MGWVTRSEILLRAQIYPLQLYSKLCCSLHKWILGALSLDVMWPEHEVDHSSLLILSLRMHGPLFPCITYVYILWYLGTRITLPFTFYLDKFLGWRIGPLEGLLFHGTPRNMDKQQCPEQDLNLSSECSNGYHVSSCVLGVCYYFPLFSLFQPEWLCLHDVLPERWACHRSSDR